MAHRSYAIVGLGAVGGFYGARLLAAGHEVHFVARSDLDHVREHGLLVESPLGDLRFEQVSVHGAPDTVPPVDVVVVAVKTTDTAGALHVVRGLVAASDDPVVVVLQNGLGVEEVLARALPGTTLLGGMCFLCSNKVGPGHIRHLDYGRVTLGEHRDDGEAAGIAGAVQAVADDLAGAGVPAVPIEDLVEGRWRKLVWNVPFNGLSVVLDAGTDELVAHLPTRRLVTELMYEVLDGAAACGKDIDRSFAEQMLADTERMRPYAPSMKLDFEAGRPMELDAIYAAPLAAARAAGRDLPRVSMLHDQLRFLDRAAPPPRSPSLPLH
ncbi:putative 2-dehydropantoate 2-reductase [Rhabdothermincola sediminis]|uniref:putative 2-dehydropantoate 2-reductase n=1 Tax=Rhabdothermincola sediminis TaxID=2751370 RepID=UPI001AA0187C|nr:putative 2-dehydropantoate 2-reductase [Rhabdothermincola sediminis]